MDAHARHPGAGCQDARGVLHCAAFSAGNHGGVRQEDGMTVKPDRWIRRMAIEHKMIEPFEDRQVREGGISYEIGRASCREKVEISVVAVSLKKKTDIVRGRRQ